MTHHHDISTMSKQAIQHYYNKIEQYTQFGGTQNELSLRRAFANLLEAYCVAKHLVLVDEARLAGTQKRPDGTVKDGNRLDWGYWESKDPADDLNAAIADKLALGYPTFNILFENTRDIVLIQHGAERLRGDMRDADRLHRILTAFVEYERPEIAAFREAVEQFKQDIPDILDALRRIISEHAGSNPAFQRAHAAFWNLCKESINPNISAFDIQEMLIQHILTAEIFNTVFGESHFHRENAVARELELVINTFFTGATRRNTLARIENYYNAIKAEAARIQHHHDKQQFLKVVYENFYNAYNPKGADKLGIVYTPNEIVKFMIESADYLLEKHFGASLADQNVEILDPATGTGTFITELIEHIPAQYLARKYAREIHANEVAILPYYIANLNIEYTYQQKMGRYEPFTNIVFVDTLDNLGFDFQGKQGTFKGFGGSIENLERIRRQNTRKISVILGNPPYNANQMNENDNNKNRDYFENPTKKTGGVDGRIKETYIKHSTAQKTKVYDMYARFYRWASDRLGESGIIAFITNRSFINSRTFDGFRRCVRQEFDAIYVIDLNGDIRADSGQAQGNVFGIKTGVAIAFFIKRPLLDLRGDRLPKQPAIIKYTSLFRFGTAKEKLAFLAETDFQRIPFETIDPDQQANWIELGGHEFFRLPQVADKATVKNAQTLFHLVTNGVVSNRDGWLYDVDSKTLSKKIKFFIAAYNRFLAESRGHAPVSWDTAIKWSRDLKIKFERRLKVKYASDKIVSATFRPFITRYFYAEKILSDRLSAHHFTLLGRRLRLENRIILYSFGKRGNFSALATKYLPNLDIFLPNATHCLGLYRYDKDGNRIDNITDWGLQQFQAHYQNKQITKEDIFYYTYAALHNPAYRKKYELNLKREFPRLPFYKDFFTWVNWGRTLMEWHVNYDAVEPRLLTIQEAALRKDAPKAKLRAVPDEGKIILDESTTLTGIPAGAWEYTLGNRSALHWILDQYKEKTPDDKTLAEQFNTYRFAEHKTTVIDLLQRVCTVAVKTVEMMKEMEREEPQ